MPQWRHVGFCQGTYIEPLGRSCDIFVFKYIYIYMISYKHWLIYDETSLHLPDKDNWSRWVIFMIYKFNWWFFSFCVKPSWLKQLTE